MSKILETAINNSKSLLENFDFTKSPKGNMFPYKRVVNNNTVEDLPILPKESSWNSDSDSSGNFIQKTFKFNSKNHLLYFLEESINKSEEMDHHPFMKIKGNIVSVLLRTDIVQDVTELDKEMALHLDEIYEDIHFIGDNF
jgi:pterin-4a-carbinolamine dehydratase